MSITHKLSYTATEIDEKLGKVDKAVLFNRQSLTEEEKAQARANIGAAEFTDEAKALLLQVLRNCVYESDQSANIAALEAIFNLTNEYEYQLMYEIDESEIVIGSATYQQSPYYQSNPIRSCYVGDEILLHYGYAYKFEFETRTEGKTLSDFRIGLQAHNSGAFERFKNGGKCWSGYGDGYGTIDTGWMISGFEFVCPEAITDNKLNTNSAMNPGFGHLAFKRQDGTAMVTGDISKVRIYRKRV